MPLETTCDYKYNSFFHHHLGEPGYENMIFFFFCQILFPLTICKLRLLSYDHNGDDGDNEDIDDDNDDGDDDDGDNSDVMVMMVMMVRTKMVMMMMMMKVMMMTIMMRMI